MSFLRTFIQIITLTITFFSGILFYLYYNQDKIKTHLLSELQKITGLEISYSKESLELFPFVSLNLNQVSLRNLELEKPLKVSLENLKLTISWKSLLLKDIQIEELILKTGNIDFRQTPPKKQINSQDSDLVIKIFSSINSLNIKSLNFEEINIQIFDSKNNLVEKFFLKQFQYSNHLNEHKILLTGGHRNGFILLNLLADIDSSLDLKNFEWRGNLRLENYSPISFKKYYSIFKTQNFDSALIWGDFYFSKQKFSSLLQCHNSFLITNLNFQNMISPLIKFNSQIGIDFDKDYINFYHIEVEQAENIIAKANGHLEIGLKVITLELNIQAQKAVLEKAIPYSLSFTEINLQSKTTQDFKGVVRIYSENTFVYDYSFKNSKVDLIIENSKIDVNILETSFYEGTISAKGTINTNSKTSYDFYIDLYNINSYNLIKRYTSKEYIAGNLNAKLHFISKGDTLESIFQELKLEGNFTVLNGKLLGYANFFEPILTFGKYLSLKGIQKESSEFLSLSGNFFVNSKQVELQNIKLVGVGIDAKGEGKISFDKKIDLKFQVGLAGFAGKILSLPIIYKGIMPNNTAYIDPIWLGSVYIGTTILGGPVGGIAGSAASEYIETGIEKVKKIFSIFSSKK